VTQAMPFAGEVGWLGWLVEHLVEEALHWLVKQHLVLMGMDFPIWIWVVLALAVILVVVLNAWRALKLHVWEAVFWMLAVAIILWFLVGW
jgi:hypothetical protein